MELPWDSINNFAATTGIGAMCLLGLLYVACAIDDNIFNYIKHYADNTGYSVMFSIPILLVSFLTGQAAIAFGSRILGASMPEVDHVITVASAQNEFLSQEFSRMKQELMIASGSALSFVVLALGLFISGAGLKDKRPLRNSIGVFLIVLTVLVGFDAYGRKKQLHDLVEATETNLDSLKSS
jgi:hypothetical protein